MDHGLTVGPIKGIDCEIGEMVNKIALGGANAVLGHVGIPLHAHRGYGPDIGLILHLSGSTSLSPDAGQNIKNEYEVGVVKIVARVAAELGADLVKTNWPGDPDSFKQVVDGCMVPVIIAGGEKTGIKGILEITKESIDVGGAGVAYGRNVFQAENPTSVVKALCLIVHENYDVNEAIKESGL